MQLVQFSTRTLQSVPYMFPSKEERFMLSKCGSIHALMMVKPGDPIPGSSKRRLLLGPSIKALSFLWARCSFAPSSTEDKSS